MLAAFFFVEDGKYDYFFSYPDFKVEYSEISGTISIFNHELDVYIHVIECPVFVSGLTSRIPGDNDVLNVPKEQDGQHA